MIHYTYIITHNNGKYYVGRHSTKNIDDNYMGSGKWVRSIKNKSELKKDIIAFYNSENEVKEAELSLLYEFVGKDNNMNFNLSACGFSSGALNPAKSDKERKRRSEFSWMKTAAGREYISINNPSKLDYVKELRSEQLKLQWNEKEYREKHIGKNHWVNQNSEAAAKFKLTMIENNPAAMPEVAAKISKSVSLAIKEGRCPSYSDPEHNKKCQEALRNSIKNKTKFINNPEAMKRLKTAALNQEKLECPHCGKVCSKSNAKGYHFDKCKKRN